MSNAKVIFGNETLIDLTQDTAEESDVLLGKSFHLKSGVRSSGTLDPVLKPDVATIEATSTASKPYSIGEYLYYDSTLYRVTASISQGGSIVTSGASANVVQTTIGDELDSVNSSLADKANVSDLVNYQKTYSADSTAWDTAPTQNSTKPVTSGGVFSALKDGTMLTGTLTAAGWANKAQTVSVTGMTASLNGVVGMLQSATAAQIQAAGAAGIRPTGQAAGTVSFACDTVPSVDIPFAVYVVK